MTFIDKILKQVDLRVPSDTHTLTGARCAYPSGGARISGVMQGTRDTVPSSLPLWGSSLVAMRNLALYRPLYPSEGNSSCPAVPLRAHMHFRLQPNQPRYFCYKTPQALLQQLEKGGVNLPWPLHQQPGAGLYTRQLHCLCAQRDFHLGWTQLTCSLSGCGRAAPRRDENGRRIMISGVS